MSDTFGSSPERDRDRGGDQSPEKKENTEIVNEFALPSQTEELDFRTFLEKPLFGSYNLYPQGGEPAFKESVVAFNGVQGRVFLEAVVVKKVSGKQIETELGIDPISLNEWRYLFSKLSLEQLYGVTYYSVQLDNGATKTIKVTLTNEGGGSYGYSVSFGNISAETVRDAPLKIGPYANLKPRIFFPKKD